MKLNKKLLLIFISIALFLFFLFTIFGQQKTSDDFIYYKLEDKVYYLKTAKTPEEWQKGLMFVKKPVNYDGMIFIFPDKKIRYFWNQNTFLDLDIYWLDGDQIIGKDYLPSLDKSKKVITLTSPLPADKVIEIIR